MDTYSHRKRRMIARVASTALGMRSQRGLVMDGQIWRTYLFNVIMIKSPRSGPQYIASCSPPQSNIFSSEIIARKQTGRRFSERTGTAEGYDIRAKVSPCVHSWKWDTQARGMKMTKILSPALRKMSRVFAHISVQGIKRRLTGREDNGTCTPLPADPRPVLSRQTTPEAMVEGTGALSWGAR